MSSKSEVGHNKNVANYSAAMQILLEMGILYNPSTLRIMLVALTPFEAMLNSVVAALNQDLATNSIDIADRETAFKKLDALITMSNNYFKSLDVDAKDKTNVNTLAKEIRGDNKNRKKVVAPLEGEKKEHSNSHQSYDNIAANFKKYNTLLSSFVEYAPNEAPISIVSLSAFADELLALTQRVIASEAALITGRKDRNGPLYFDTPNVITLMRDVKAYVKSLGAPGKPYYDALVRLKFKDITSK